MWAEKADTKWPIWKFCDLKLGKPRSRPAKTAAVHDKVPQTQIYTTSVSLGGAAALESGLQLAKHYLHASCLHLSTRRVLAGTQPKQYTLLHIQVTLLAAWICLQPTLQAGPQALPGSREKIVAPGASISHEITRHQAKKNLRFLSKKLQNATSCAPKRSRIKPRIACHKKRVEVRFCNSFFSEFGVVLPEKPQSWCG